MRWSVAAMFSGFVELTGAFLIGGVLHQSLVQGAFPVTAPASVAGILGGIALIVVGRRLERRFEPSRYVPGAEDEEEDEEFEEDLSPVPEERLAERDPEGSATDRTDAEADDRTDVEADDRADGDPIEGSGGNDERSEGSEERSEGSEERPDGNDEG